MMSRGYGLVGFKTWLDLINLLKLDHTLVENIMQGFWKKCKTWNLTIFRNKYCLSEQISHSPLQMEICGRQFLIWFDKTLLQPNLILFHKNKTKQKSSSNHAKLKRSLTSILNLMNYPHKNTLLADFTMMMHHLNNTNNTTLPVQSQNYPPWNLLEISKNP